MDIPEAIACLDALPTPDAIADELVSMGIKAHQGEPHACAIAVYLHETVGVAVGIGTLSLTVGNGPVRREGIIAYPADSWAGTRCKAPRVAEFVHEFDRGKYPKLLKEEI